VARFAIDRLQFSTTLDGWFSTYKIISAESLSRMFASISGVS
jgi:hypothetical protein